MQSNVRTLTLTNANTEYPITLSVALGHITFQCRTDDAVRFATASGKVATSVEPYATLKAGSSFALRDLHPDVTAGETLYFASSVAGAVVEFVETIN